MKTASTCSGTRSAYVFQMSLMQRLSRAAAAAAARTLRAVYDRHEEDKAQVTRALVQFAHVHMTVKGMERVSWKMHLSGPANVLKLDDWQPSRTSTSIPSSSQVPCGLSHGPAMSPC
jgi:hypothetical protein